MSDWGEDEYEPEDAGSSSTTAAAPSGGRAFGIDVGSLADELVDAAVKSLVRKEVSTVAAEAVKDALTDDVLDALRDRAETAAAAAIAAQLEDSGLDDDTEAEVPDAAESVLTYGSVDEFLREYLRSVYRRKIDGKNRVWAAEWWKYDEAVIRLEALWRSWEFLRRDPSTGMSVWWRDHADTHMAVLMDPQGPFAPADAMAPENQCSKGDPLPYKQPPEGLFPDVREANPETD
ncbi:DUF4913 domain-containing protein (plasmid) [Streptomyces sp. L7]|uniref:DUF4913 domain-containing protein n=1 Tax=Actinomycetes TaxID=1760 RepID=UPI00389B1850